MSSAYQFTLSDNNNNNNNNFNQEFEIDKSYNENNLLRSNISNTNSIQFSVKSNNESRYLLKSKGSTISFMNNEEKDEKEEKKEFTLNEKQINNDSIIDIITSNNNKNIKNQHQIKEKPKENQYNHKETTEKSTIPQSDQSKTRQNQIISIKENQIKDLIDLTELMEEKLSISTKQKLKLVERIRLIEKENEGLSVEIQEYEKEIFSYKNDLKSKEDLMKMIEKENLFKVNMISKELQEKTKENDYLNKELSKKKEEISKITNKQKEFLLKIEQIEKENQKKQEEILKLIEEKMNFKSESEFQIEIDYLKKDNQRLIEALKSVNHNENYDSNWRFCVKAENSKMTLMKNASNLLNEWIPKDVIDELKGFVNSINDIKHLKSNDDENVSLNSILYSLIENLNKIWSERERHLLIKIGKNHKKTINDYKRKLLLSSKTDEIVNKKEISMLKKENRLLKSENNELIKENSKLKSLPKGILTVKDDIITKVNQMNLTKFENENKKLMETIQKYKENEEERRCFQKEDKEKERKDEKEVVVNQILFDIDSLYNDLSVEYFQRYDLILNDYEGNSCLIRNLNKWFVDSFVNIIKKRISN